MESDEYDILETIRLSQGEWQIGSRRQKQGETKMGQSLKNDACTVEPWFIASFGHLINATKHEDTYLAHLHIACSLHNLFLKLSAECKKKRLLRLVTISFLKVSSSKNLFETQRKNFPMF